MPADARHENELLSSERFIARNGCQNLPGKECFAWKSTEHAQVTYQVDSSNRYPKEENMSQKSLSNSSALFFGGVLVAASTGIASIAGAAPAGTAVYNGKVISSHVKVIGGVAYIPLADTARALGGSVAKDGEGYAIESSSGAAGGSNQINGLNGKIGQMLFTGSWRFEVTSVTIVQSFTEQYRPQPTTINPAGANDELVVVSGIVKNGQKDTEQLFMRTANPNDNTITDNQGASYGGPLDYDFPSDSGYGPQLAPGAASKFNMVFQCPKGTTLQSLIFTVKDFGSAPAKDVRVDISSANGQ